MSEARALDGEDLRAILSGIVLAEETQSLLDCTDNDGHGYQSQYLADLLDRARALLSGLSDTAPSGDTEVERLRDALSLYDSAISEAEAILGGEYDMHFGPFFDMVQKAREALAGLRSSALHPATLEAAARVCETHAVYYVGSAPEKLVPSETGQRVGKLFAGAIRSLTAPAVPQPVVPEGWKLVPVEPTEEMLFRLSEWFDDRSPDRRWAGILAAAPQHQDAGGRADG